MVRQDTQRLSQFVDWAKAHITGDEKGESQIFLDRLFQAFGHPGLLEVGGRPEFRIKPRTEDAGGTRFADYVWRGVVLIEMKKRGEDLSKHLSQVFDYWTRIVPGRPPYVVLCNFDEFRIYDFNADLNEPQDTITLAELPDHPHPLGFLFKVPVQPRFRIDRLGVTRKAADLLAQTYNRLAQRRDVGPETAQRFILQMLVALFSEDIDLLPRHFVTQLLDECTDPPKAFDLLGGLFHAMNTPPGKARGGRYKDIPYFNGGIFNEPAPIELDSDEVHRLKGAASENWSYVSPDIFGTIFQHSMGKDKRHAYGAHYTAPIDIMKIVGPTIIQPWREQIARADSPERLRTLRQRLSTYRVLDPACGSGNFLYTAYRELKRIEKELADKAAEVGGKSDRSQRFFGVVTSKQFFGLDILPFAVELAKVTMTIAHKLAIDELHVQEDALPLDNLDKNILCIDGLIDWPIDGSTPKDYDPKRVRSVPSWPEADAIIGNPPFIGAKDLKPERGAGYANALHLAYPEVPGMADYCVHWFRRAHDLLKPSTPEDPLTGRAGLVGTQNIRNNKSRVGGLDHVVKSGTIIEAVENQPWSGEANVSVSIANWVKHEPPKTKSGRPSMALEQALGLPLKRRLWRKIDPTAPLFEGEPRAGAVVSGKRGRTRKDKSYELEVREVDQINSALSDRVDASVARALQCNTDPQRIFQGVTPGQKGFVLSAKERTAIVAADRKSKSVIFPYLVGRELLGGDGSPARYLIDFQPLDQIRASTYAAAFDRVRRLVLPMRKKNLERVGGAAGTKRTHHTGFMDRWWRLAWERDDMLAAFKPLARFIVCSRVTKRPIFVFLSPDIRPGDALQTFAFDDDYSFGILQSDAHWQWFITKCSKLTERYRYTPESVFDTFPWPQSPTGAQVLAIARAAIEVRRMRDQFLPTIKGGLRALYRTLELPGKNPLKDAHATLDAAVLDAYGFSPKKDILSQLLALNLSVASRIDKGEPVTPPGIPPGFRNPGKLISDDCIKPAPLPRSMNGKHPVPRTPKGRTRR